jgi:DNA-binding MarR family transcriptional regulator
MKYPPLKYFCLRLGFQGGMKGGMNSSAALSADRPVSHQLTELFWVLSPAYTRWAESHMNQQGLTPQRVRLLWELKEQGPVIMSDLRDALGVTAANVTALVDALEKDKMVTRKAHATDRRATVIAITPKAEALLTEKCAEFKEKVADLFSGFTSAEQTKFASYLERMRDALVERNILEESDGCHATKGKRA